MGTAGENGTPAIGGSVSIQTSFPKPARGAGLGLGQTPQEEKVDRHLAALAALSTCVHTHQAWLPWAPAPLRGAQEARERAARCWQLAVPYCAATRPGGGGPSPQSCGVGVWKAVPCTLFTQSCENKTREGICSMGDVLDCVCSLCCDLGL